MHAHARSGRAQRALLLVIINDDVVRLQKTVNRLSRASQSIVGWRYNKYIQIYRNNTTIRHSCKAVMTSYKYIKDKSLVTYIATLPPCLFLYVKTCKVVYISVYIILYIGYAMIKPHFRDANNMYNGLWREHSDSSAVITLYSLAHTRGHLSMGGPGLL